MGICLGLDLGTTNVKALLVEECGEVIARASAPVRLIHTGDAGVEQDIEEIWEAALSAIRQLAQRHGLSAVRALGVSSQGGALQLLDASGAPADRVISWLDGCAEPENDALTRELGSPWFAEHVGHGRSGLAIGQILRHRRLYPKLFARGIQVGFVGDVIVSRLCGRRAHDATSLSIALLYNPKLGKADPDLLARLGLAEEQLPALLSPRTAAGALLDSVARQTGLPAGIPVSPAVHDQYASTLGAGAVTADDLMLGTGTAWVLLAATAELLGPVADAAFACTHLLDGLYGQLLSLGNGGSSVTMALNLTGQTATSTDFDDLLDEVPAGSDGLRYWPFLVPYGGAGLAQGTSARLLNLRLDHTPAHVLRAVVEGLALEVRRYLEFVFSAHIVPRRIVLCGSAAAGSATPQILANAAGLPIDCVSESDTSALGAAVLARGLVEPDASLANLAASMGQPLQPFEPDRDAALYREMLAEYLTSLPKAR